MHMYIILSIYDATLNSVVLCHPSTQRSFPTVLVEWGRQP